MLNGIMMVLFTVMPGRKTPNGEFKDIAHPINPVASDKTRTAVLEKNENTVSEIDDAAVEIG